MIGRNAIAPDKTLPQVLPKNFLRPCLLLLLREQPAHGYELLEVFLSRYSEFVAVKPAKPSRTARD